MNIDEYKQIKASIDESMALIFLHISECNVNLRMFDNLTKLAVVSSVDVPLLDATLSHIYSLICDSKSLYQEVSSLLSGMKGDSHD